MTTRNEIVKIAKSYLGVKQGSKEHKKLVDTFNKKSPHGEKGNYNCPWCAIFWTAISVMAGMTEKETPMSYNCGTLIEDAKKLGIWQENDNYPDIKKGDGIIYDWSDNGVGENKDGCDHVGMVVSVSGNNIKVIEGNYSTKQNVSYRTIKRNQRYIRGFITPKYVSERTKVISKAIKWAKSQVGKPYKPYGKKGEGYNCIGLVSYAYHKAGTSVKASASGFINSDMAAFNKLTEKKLQARAGKDFNLYKYKDGIPKKKRKKGDVILTYSGNKYKHTLFYIGAGLIIDATPRYGVKIRKYKSVSSTPKVIIRYKGD